MQIAAADIGNSSVKFFFGDAIRICETGQVAWPPSHHLGIEAISGEAPLVGQPMPWFVSSVNAKHAHQLEQRLTATNEVSRWHVLQRQEVPLTLDVDQPNTVGMDRILAGFAAHRLWGAEQDVIVVDCGTALTIDLVQRSGVFRGGVIMAGPATNLRALNMMTEALPSLSQEKLMKPASVLGRSTREAMLGGAWFSGLGAIRTVVDEMQALCETPPRIVGTGGGLGPWRDVLPKDWILADDLVLKGLFHVAVRLMQEPHCGAE